jgi:Putative adhesin
VRVVVLVAAAALVIGAVVSLSTLAWGVSTFRVVTDSTALPAALRSVTVNTGSVPVAIRITTDRGAREPRVDMRMVNSTRAGADPLSVNTDGTAAQVTIDAEDSPILDWGRASEITLVLPPDVARRLTVTTQQEVGVVFAQADLDALVARSRDGSVVLSGSARRIEISNEHGDVATREPISVTESFRAVTQSGDVDVEFDGAPKTVEARTEHGDVELALPQPGPFVVNATTAHDWGSTVVQVPQTRDESEAVSVIDAHSETGDVAVEELSRSASR